MNNNRTVIDDRLDKMYMKALRCPYCHSKIQKGTAKCPNCGITKEQIYRANLVVRKHEKNTPRVKPVVIYSKVRPENIPFWKMALGGLFGFLGVHCFISKRYWRGAVILTCTILFFVFGMVFNAGYINKAGEEVAAHALRQAFERRIYIFPPDLLAFVTIIMWIWDWVCILLGKFKYPVVIDTEDGR